MAKKSLTHLSDLHIGLRQKESTHTKKLVAKIAECYPGVPVIITGDLTDSARGYISSKLANALTESLKQYAGKTRFAFLHHHPFTEGFFTKLRGSKKLMDAIKDNCELLIFGHEHEYGIWWKTRGVPLIVSSHKSTDKLSGDCLMITIIEIENVGTENVSFRQRLEVV